MLNKRTKIVAAHEKKLAHLSSHSVLPFKSHDVITNLSDYQLKQEESDLLKYGLSHAMPPMKVNKTDVLLTFEQIYKCLSTELIDKGNEDILKTELSHLANNYHTKYKPSLATIRKHKIIKRLRDKNDLIFVRPDKGNGLVIMNRIDYITKMVTIINDVSKFKLLNNDPTKTREVKLQNFLRSLKGKKFFTDE